MQKVIGLRAGFQNLTPGWITADGNTVIEIETERENGEKEFVLGTLYGDSIWM